MNRNKVKGIQVLPVPDELEEKSVIYEDGLASGMFPNVNPAKIPEGGFTGLENMIIRDGTTNKAPGTVGYSITKPNSNRVLHLANHIDANKVAKLVRHTRNSVHYATAASWVNVVITPALTGLDSDQIRSSIIDYNYIFSNNGKDPLQLVDFVGNTCAPLSSSAPTAKRVFGFNNRTIGINIIAGAAPYTVNDPSLVVWSGLNNYGQFDYTTDISAGFKRLVNSPSDTSDFLVDGMGFDNVALLVRQRSIWIMSPQPISTEPFFFYPAIPNRGCSCDYGVAKLDNGIAFIDINTADVYILSVDDNITNRQAFNLESIGGPVKRHLFNAIEDPNAVFAGYNAREKEISFAIYIPSVGTTKQWTYSTIYKAWTYREYDSITCIGDLISLTSGLSIDELVGTMEDLPLTMDELSGTNTISPFRVLGAVNGEIVIVSDSVYTDAVIGLPGANATFDCEIISRLINIPSRDIDITCFHFGIVLKAKGVITLSISKDMGKSWVDIKNFSLQLDSMLDKRMLLTCRKVLHTETLMFKLTSGSAFNLMDYEILGTPGGNQS